MRRIFFIYATLMVFTSVKLYAQVAPQDFTKHPRQYINRNSFWTETVIMGKIKGKFSFQVDYQYRRMADSRDVANGNYSNIFANPFQQVVRPWIHFQLSPAVRFSLSPLGYWATWNQPTTDASGTKSTTFVPELRICPQLTLNQNIGRIAINQRYRYEFRYLGNAVLADKNASDYTKDLDFPYANRKGRLRYFVRAIIPINHKTLESKTWFVNTFNEIFIGTQRHTANNKLLDQNRAFAGIGYKFNPHLRLEMGYLLQVVFKYNDPYYSKNNVEKNNVLQLYLTIENLGEWLKKTKSTSEK